MGQYRQGDGRAAVSAWYQSTRRRKIRVNTRSPAVLPAVERVKSLGNRRLKFPV